MVKWDINVSNMVRIHLLSKQVGFFFLSNHFYGNANKEVSFPNRNRKLHCYAVVYDHFLLLNLKSKTYI